MHLNQEEWFYVIEGDVAFQVGEKRLHLHAGESLLGPRRVPHTVSSIGATPGRMLIAFTPAGKMEDYFLDLENPNPPKRKRVTTKSSPLGPLRFGRSSCGSPFAKLIKLNGSGQKQNTLPSHIYVLYHDSLRGNDSFPGPSIS